MAKATQGELGPIKAPFSANLPERSDRALLACHVVDANGRAVAQMMGHEDDEVRKYACLFAAAPDMSDALQKITFDVFDVAVNDHPLGADAAHALLCRVYDFAQAALAKAEQRQ